MQHQKQPKPFYFQWHFLDQCPLRCAHCYQEGYASCDLPDNDVMTIASIMESTLQKWERQGRVSLTGGEPFLKIDLLLKLLNFFEHSPHFYWMGILTNGVLINDAISDRLKGFEKLNEIQVSIDGSCAQVHDAIRGPGNFDHALNGLSILKRNGFTVSIMFTLHRKNAEDAPRMVELAEQLGVDFLTIERVVPNDDCARRELFIAPRDLEKIYTSVYEKKKIVEGRSNLKVRVSRPLWGLVDEHAGGFCPAGLSCLSILHDGTILPCRRLEIPIGNVLRDGIFNPWYTSDVLWKLRNKKLLSDKCSECTILGKCGGCRAIAYQMTGDFMAEDPQCWKDDELKREV
ncbi:MAG: radical SAM protein [Candidatus Omnitrophota bacterium]